jgi:preprotein translocase SecY subunit
MDVDLVPAPVAMVAASGRKSDLDPLSSAVEADVPTRQSAHPFDPLGLAERHNVEESEWYPGAQAAHARWALLTELGRSHTGVLKEYAEHMFQDCSLLTPETSEGKVAMLATGGKSSVTAKTEEPPGIGDFFGGDLPGKFLTLLALLAISRVGVYIPLPGVDVERFADAIQSSGMMGYVDTLSGGSISKLGIFSLGIIPYINASIIIQLAVQLNPELKKIQREEGERGRNKIKNYMRVGALGFAIIQSFGQCTFIRPYVDDFTIQWLAQSIGLLTGGAMGLVFISERLDKLKLGNGTSLMIFANIVSALPGSIGTALKQSQEAGNTSALAVFFAAFAAVALGIVYVQEAERKIPIVYASKFRAGGLSQRAYLPFKVNAAGVMPIIFASSILALPSTIARFMNNESIMNFARAVAPGGNIYIPLNVTMIAFFNYFYTFLQLDPNDVSEQLKKQGASIPGIRPGKSTEEYISGTLERMSVLGSGFLGALALAPSLVEATTHLTVLRGFGGTSLLILVGVATDTARKIQSEMVMQKYKTSLDNLYESENLDNL